MKTIKLHGELADKYGKSHKLDINSPAEAVAAMCARFPGFTADIVKHNWKLVTRRRKNGREGMALIRPQLRLPFRRGEKELHFIPTPEPAGIELFILGGLLLAAVGVIIGLSIPPQAADANAREDEKASFIFSGPVNQIEQGHPVPLVYGQMEVGSIVGSSSLENGDLNGTNTLPSGTGKFGSGSTGGLSSATSTWQVAGGGKAGGSQRAAQEDPNTLQSESTAFIMDILSEGECEGPPTDDLQWVKFNETPLENPDGSFNFHGVDIRPSVGLATQDPFPGQNAAAVTTDVSVPITIANGAITRTIVDPDTTRAKVTIELPALWKQDTENGDLLKTSVAVKIELQSDGGGFTTVYTGTGNDRANFANQKTVAPYWRDFSISLPAGGAPWDIRVSRITADGDDASISNDTNWKFLTEIVDAPFTYPYTAAVGVAVSAQQFGSKIPKRSYIWRGLKVSVPANYDPVTRVYATSGTGTSNGEWDGTFKTAWTDNPAWVFYDLCTNKRYGLGSAMDPPNKWSLYTIAKYSDQLVDDGAGGQEPRFTCNLVLNKRTQALAVLRALASSFRSITFWNQSSIRVHQDAPEDPVQIIGPANTVDGRINYNTRSVSEEYSAWIVTWNDPEEGYKQNFEIVEDATKIRDVGWKPNEVAAFGCTSRGQAARFGRWLRDDQTYANEQFETTLGADVVQHYPGQIVKISDPLFTLDRRTGRCLSGSTVSSVVTDGDLSGVADLTLVSVTLPDGSVEQKTISNITTTDGISTITTTTNFSAAPAASAMWVVETSTVAARLFRVLQISETDNNEFAVAGLIHDPNKYSRVEQNLNLEPPPYTGVPTGPLEPPPSVVAKEFLRESGDSAVPALRVSWNASQDPRGTDYDCQFQLGDDAWVPISGPEPLSRELDNVTVGTYRFRVRTINGLGQRGPWKLSVDYALNGPTVPLPDVSGLTFNRDDEALQTTLRWAVPVDERPFVYRLYRNSINDFDTAGFLGEFSTNEYVVTETGFYWVEVAFMQERSPAPAVIEIVQSNLPKPHWNNVENRPLTLADLDPTSAVDLAAAVFDIGELETTYGSTASAAASAAAASSAQSASETAQGLAETAQGLAETAEASALASATSASEASGVAVTATVGLLPSTFENADLYFTKSVNVSPETASDVTDDAHLATTTDTVEGPGIRSTGAGGYICTKGALPAIVGNTYRVRVRLRANTTPTVDTTFRIRRFGVDWIHDGGAVGGTITHNVGNVVEDELTYTMTQAHYDAGTRWLRGEILANNGGTTDEVDVFLLEFKDLTSETNAASSASAAATHASTAGASETAAGQSASAAQISETNAQTSAANAFSSETNAASSETNAAGSAAAASSSETNAALSETNAGSSASAAALSASTASSSATDAGVEAAAASGSAVIAIAAAVAAGPVRADDNELFTNDVTYSVSSALPAVTSGVGLVLPSATVGANGVVRPKKIYAHDPDAVYEITYQWITTDNGTNADAHARFGLYGYDAAGANVDNNIQPAGLDMRAAVADGLQKQTYTVGGSNTTGTDSKLSVGTLEWRPHMRQNAVSSDGQIGLFSIEVVNVTARDAATGAATAAAASASSASASENAAGQSSTAAQLSETNAGTSASNASISEGNAALSETNSAGSAAAAATSSNLAASAVDAAIAASILSLPSTFEDGGTYFTTQRSKSPAASNDATDVTDEVNAFTDATEGPGLRLGGGTGAYLYPKNMLPYVVGDTYRITTKIRVTATPTSDNIRTTFVRQNGDYTFYSQSLSSGLSFPDGNVTTFVDEYTATQASYDAGARWMKTGLAFNLAGSGSNDGEWEVFQLLFENITAQAAAASSASAAAASESAAAASETAAGGFATASSASEINAGTSASNAFVSETNAAASATSASDSAAVASTASEIAARLNEEGYVTNPTFAIWDTANGRPHGYGNWGSNFTVRESTITKFGVDAWRMNDTGGGNAGARAQNYTSYNGLYGIEQSANYRQENVISAWVYLVSGTWSGAGLNVNFRRNTNGGTSAGSSDGTFNIHFGDLGLPTGRWCRVQKYWEQSTVDSTTDGMILYVMSNWTTFDGTFPAKDIIWGSVSVRPATDMEVEANKVISVEASVATNASAIATNNGSIATLNTTVTTNTASIGTNATAISTAETDIATLNSSVAANGASITTNATAISDIDGTLQATYAMRVKAGTAGAEFELIALDDPNGATSTARLAADNIILDGTITALHLTDGSIFNLAQDNSSTDVELSSSNTNFFGPYLSKSFVSVGKKVRIDVDITCWLETDDTEAVSGINFTTDHKKEFTIKIFRGTTLVSERVMGFCFATEAELDDFGLLPLGGGVTGHFSNSVVVVDEPSAGTYTYTMEIQCLAKQGGSDNRKTIGYLGERTMLITEIDN